jgi:hypothetical protein
MGATVGARLPLLVEPGELVANINPLPRSWLNAVQATISEANAKTVGLGIVQKSCIFRVFRREYSAIVPMVNPRVRDWS